MWIFVLIVIVLLSISSRLWWIASNLGKGLELDKQNVKVLAVAGSGGHTTELLRLLKALSSQYSPRYYVVADTDRMSSAKIRGFEKENKSLENKNYFIKTIPRSREVAQPWLSSAWTTFVATMHSFSIIWRSSPDLILCNGPGTCIPLCLVGFLFKFLGLSQCQIVFVESICRVKTLSLSGLILYYWADLVFVQWPELQQKYPKTLYIGRIV